MTVEHIVIGIIAIVIAYLLGSIPAAYIITRLRMGKDIRKLGGGNVGARNVFVEVGKAAGIGVAIFDVVKGAAAVAIAEWLLGGPKPFVPGPGLFVLVAGLAAVAGHIWSIYLKFTGGNGLATALGILSLLMTKELLIALAITVLLVVVTRNPVLSVNLSLLSVPISGWFLEGQWLYVVFAIILIVMMVLHFLPVAKADFARAGSIENFVAELLRKKKS
jgi:glycerol-3-phosphate acyltransferase PlsY